MAGAVLVTNGLDLGMGLVTLAYGGSLVLADSSELTVGELVTFQLYANVMTSAYQVCMFVSCLIPVFPHRELRRFCIIPENPCIVRT